MFLHQPNVMEISNPISISLKFHSCFQQFFLNHISNFLPSLQLPSKLTQDSGVTHLLGGSIWQQTEPQTGCHASHILEQQFPLDTWSDLRNPQLRQKSVCVFRECAADLSCGYLNIFSAAKQNTHLNHFILLQSFF